MDGILGFIQSSMGWVFLVVALIVVGLYINSRYKIPKADEALAITGGKKGLRVLPGRGAFVSPLRKYQYFPLGVMTVRSNDQETQTSTLVPVVVQWTAQLRADVETDGALAKAVQGFSGFTDEDSIKQSLQQTLDGEVRAVVATMTPVEVVRNKDDFSTKVAEGVQQRMEDLGFKLVSLNIAEVTDRNGHYHNLAAEDREEKRKVAEKTAAEANKEVTVAQAAATQQAKAAEQERDMAVAEQERELALRRAAIKAETDQAQADADIAGQLQLEIRNQELAARQGEVEVIREQQRRAAAVARREVEVTEAETNKQTLEISAAAEAKKTEIEAEAAASVAVKRAEGEANANAANAEGEARAAKAKAQGDADALNLMTQAEAEQIRQTGLAQAEAAKAQGEAEAAAILAKGEAEAEVQRKMAEALAANDGANLRVTLAEIQRDTTVRVFTTVGEAMARIGEHATFIDMGGSSGDGDLLSKVLGNVPEMLKKLDVKSLALNGAPFGDSIGSVVSAVTGGAVSSDRPGSVIGGGVTDVANAAESGKPAVALSEALSTEAVASRLGVEPETVSGLVEAALGAATDKVSSLGSGTTEEAPSQEDGVN